ncbi:hypothetical protein CN918_25995 [Priestia megaterium]|nr:hypothetical protein CN918_25995 [Priestia megaterium]
MTIKRTLLFIFLFLFLLPISAYAAPSSDGQFYLITHLTTIIKGLSSVLLLIATLIILYGGFGYAFSYNNEEALEESKVRIIYGAVGLFISLGMVGMAKLINVMAGNNPPNTTSFSSLLIGICITVLILFIGFILYKRMKTNNQSLDNERNVQPPSQLCIPSEDLYTFLSILSNKKCSFQSSTTEIRGEMDTWHAEYHTSPSSMYLYIFVNERLVLDSTIKDMNSTQQHSFAENVSLEGESIPLSSLLLTIHQSYIEQFLQQHHRIEDWVKIKTSSISSNDIFHSLCKLGKNHQRLLSYAKQCTDEQKHFLEHSFFQDLEKMLIAYQELSPALRQEHEAGLLLRIAALSNRLASIQESVDIQKERDMAFAFRVIDEKYKKN